MLRLAGARQAARDRNLQLKLFYPRGDLSFQVVEALEFLWSAAQGGVDAIVTTLPYEEFMAPLLAAHDFGIPVYIIGGTSLRLMSILRSPERLFPLGVNPNAALLNIGMDEDAVSDGIVARLVAAGVRHAVCLQSSPRNVIYTYRCSALESRFQARNLTSDTQDAVPSSLPLRVLMASIERSLANSNPRVYPNATAIVLMDATMYRLLRGVLVSDHAMATAHVVSYESSPAVLADLQAGMPVVLVRQSCYSQGYAAVALAAYELQTGQMLTADIRSAPHFRSSVLASEFVSQEDIIAERCRLEGYPVCGTPGVAEVSATGCPCFNRTELRVRVLSSLVPAWETYYYVKQGLMDAARDTPGSSYEWVASEANATTFDAVAAINATMASKRWSAAISLGQMNPTVKAAIQALGAAKGNRTFWMGSDRDERVAFSQFLSTYNADGYMGSTAATWAKLGALARQHLQEATATPIDALLFAALHAYPTWDQMAEGFIYGFFNDSGVPFPDSFWDVPSPPTPGSVNATRDWLDFYELNVPGGGTVAANGFDNSLYPSPSADPSSVAPTNASLGDRAAIEGDWPSITASRLASLRVRPAPVIRNSSAGYLDALQGFLHAQLPAGLSAVALLPQGSLAMPDLLAIMEDLNTSHGRDVQLFSLRCRYNGYVALASSGSIKGAHRFQGCTDIQLNLATYLMFVASALDMHTREHQFRGIEVSTGRILVRQNATNRIQRRRADCEYYNFVEGVSKGRDGMLYPVCNHSAGCGDVANLCSGRGTCTFPTAEANAAAGGSLNPAVGKCVCENGWHGPMCSSGGFLAEASRNLHVSQWVLIGMATLVSVLLVALGMWFAYKRISPARRAHAREAKKRRPPKDHEEVAVVFTDIKGSTGLWEWDAGMMSQCIQIHHRVLRALLPKYHGYESNTEGDAFELVFHDAVDALNWVLEAQEALMYPERVLAPLRRPLGPGPRSLSHVSQRDTWPEKLLQHEMGQEKLADDGTVIYRGLRVRMGLHVGKPDASYQHPNGRQRYTGRVVDMAKAVGDAPEDGGQVLLTMNAWYAVGSGASIKNLVIHNLGEYILSKDLPPVQVLEVLREGLRKRSPFRPLRCVAQVSPSFYAAPASNSYVTGEPPSEPIIIMFTFIGSMQALKANPFFKESVALLVDFMRAKICLHRGYECEEKDGNFLITFADPMDAAVFTQDVQAGAMKLPWPDDILREEAAAEVLLPSAIDQSASNPASDPAFSDKFVFRGLRLKIGMYMGLPTKCMPHATTGRAAYFGPIVNRSARIATTAADGQTLCNVTMVQALQAGGYKFESQSLMFSSLGHFPLKGLMETLELYQISTPRTAVRLFPRTRGSKAHLDRKSSNPISVEQVLSRGGRHSIDETYANSGAAGANAHRISFSLSPRSNSNSSGPNSPTGGAYRGFDVANRMESITRLNWGGTRAPSLVDRDGDEASNLLAQGAMGSADVKDPAQLQEVLKRPLPFFAAYVRKHVEKDGEGASGGPSWSRPPSGTKAVTSLPLFVERNVYQELTDLRMEVEEYRMMVTTLRAQLAEASEASDPNRHDLLPGYASGKGNPPAMMLDAGPPSRRLTINSDRDIDTIVPVSPPRSPRTPGFVGTAGEDGATGTPDGVSVNGSEHPLFLAKPRRNKPYLVQQGGAERGQEGGYLSS